MYILPFIFVSWDCYINYHRRVWFNNRNSNSAGWSLKSSRWQNWQPMGCSTPGFPVLHCHLEFAQTHVCWASDVIRPLHPHQDCAPECFRGEPYNLSCFFLLLVVPGVLAVAASLHPASVLQPFSPSLWVCLSFVCLLQGHLKLALGPT